jgi:hypothetical protein
VDLHPPFLGKLRGSKKGAGHAVVPFVPLNGFAIVLIPCVVENTQQYRHYSCDAIAGSIGRSSAKQERGQRSYSQPSRARLHVFVLDLQVDARALPLLCLDCRRCARTFRKRTLAKRGMRLQVGTPKRQKRLTV